MQRRGLSEKPTDIRVVTKSCNIKLINEITWTNVNHSSGTALGRSVINNWCVRVCVCVGGLNRFYRYLTSPSATAVVHNI